MLCLVIVSRTTTLNVPATCCASSGVFCSTRVLQRSGRWYLSRKRFCQYHEAGKLSQEMPSSAATSRAWIASISGETGSPPFEDRWSKIPAALLLRGGGSTVACLPSQCRRLPLANGTPVAFSYSLGSTSVQGRVCVSQRPCRIRGLGGWRADSARL